MSLRQTFLYQFEKWPSEGSCMESHRWKLFWSWIIFVNCFGYRISNWHFSSYITPGDMDSTIPWIIELNPHLPVTQWPLVLLKPSQHLSTDVTYTYRLTWLYGLLCSRYEPTLWSANLWSADFGIHFWCIYLGLEKSFTLMTRFHFVQFYAVFLPQSSNVLKFHKREQ